MFEPEFDIVLLGSHPSRWSRQRVYRFEGVPRNRRARRLCRKHNGGRPQALVTGLPELMSDPGHRALTYKLARDRIDGVVAKAK